MSPVLTFEPGGYAFQKGGVPYSQGVVALPGFAIVRVRFQRPLPVAKAFPAIAAHLKSQGRPLHALCAAELRSPQPFTLDGFREFNAGYVSVLESWRLYKDGINPVARSNVCPAFEPPAEPSFHAFCYTVPIGNAAATGAPRTYVIAGSGEWPEDQPFPEGIVARGDVSPTGMARKVDYVIRTMRQRAAALSADWSMLTAAQVYTVHDFHGLLATHFAPAGLTGVGLTWQVCRPPILELEFEMDVRSVATERVLVSRG